MSDDSEYEPALDSTTTEESSAESEPVVKRAPSPASAAAATVPAVAPVEKIGQPAGDDEDAKLELGPRAPRSWSGKSRALFKAVVQQVQASEAPIESGDELEPMGHPTPATAPAPASAAKPAPVAAPAVAPAIAPAPVTPPPAPPGLPPLPELPLAAVPAAAQTPAAATSAPDPKHAEREAAIAARESALVEREKLLPDRLAIAENPAGTLVSWLRDTHGITDDGEMKLAISDLVTELSEIGLKVTLPPEIKAALESRKALRSVKAYRASLDQREQAIVKQRADADKAAAESRAAAEQTRLDTAYVARLGELIAPAAAQHPFLHDTEITGGVSPAVIVYEVLKEQKRLGHPPDLAKAADYANSYYKAQAEALAKRAARIQPLLAPAASTPAVVAPAAAASPGGAPGPAPTPAAKPAPAPVERDPSDLPADGRSRRQQSLAKILAAQKAAASA